MMMIVFFSSGNDIFESACAVNRGWVEGRGDADYYAWTDSRRRRRGGAPLVGKETGKKTPTKKDFFFKKRETFNFPFVLIIIRWNISNPLLNAPYKKTLAIFYCLLFCGEGALLCPMSPIVTLGRFSLVFGWLLSDRCLSTSKSLVEVMRPESWRMGGRQTEGGGKRDFTGNQG